MSRSFKKHPGFQIAGDKGFKKIFNRRIRRAKKLDDIPDGGAYKKLNDSYDIADYKEIGPKWEDFYEGHKLLNTPEEKEELYKIWLKWYRSK